MLVRLLSEGCIQEAKNGRKLGPLWAMGIASAAQVHVTHKARDPRHVYWLGSREPELGARYLHERHWKAHETHLHCELEVRPRRVPRGRESKLLKGCRTHGRNQVDL